MTEPENEFYRLVENIKTGKLGRTHIKNAYKAAIEQNPEVPEPIKGLLLGSKVFGGTQTGLVDLIVDPLFRLLGEIQGRLEVAYGRGYQAGQEDKEQP